MLNNTTVPVIPAMNNNFQPIQSLELTQIEDYEPVKHFVDSAGIEWALVKDSRDSYCEIPDPSAINFTDCWNHEYPNTAGKVYIYVVEGIKLPKTAREKSCNVMYCWFSRKCDKNFNPKMITAGEWLMANVYASSCNDSRISKLKALCKITDNTPVVTPVEHRQPPLIKIDNLGGNNDSKSNRQAGKGN